MQTTKASLATVLSKVERPKSFIMMENGNIYLPLSSSHLDILLPCIVLSLYLLALFLSNTLWPPARQIYSGVKNTKHKVVVALTAWCSEIGFLLSLNAPELHVSSDVREPISLHHNRVNHLQLTPPVCTCVTFFISFFFILV